MQSRLDAIQRDTEKVRNELLDMLSADGITPRNAKTLAMTVGLLSAVVTSSRDAAAILGRTTNDLWS